MTTYGVTSIDDDSTNSVEIGILAAPVIQLHTFHLKSFGQWLLGQIRQELLCVSEKRRHYHRIKIRVWFSICILGKYCVYKKGETCPLTLSPGSVKWDDENKNNQGEKEGTLPEGEYDRDTIIKYCCSTSGDANVPISLPTLKPFFLLAYGSSQCQQVKWAVTSKEWIRFDTEDRGNSDREWGAYPYGAGIKDHNITYCYYQGVRLLWFYSFCHRPDNVQARISETLDIRFQIPLVM